MYIIIAGCGRVGFGLAKALLAGGHEVTVIEQSHIQADNAARELGNVALRGDGSSLETLREAGASRADLVIAVTGDDASNLAVCQMAKQSFQTPTTMAVVKNPSHSALFTLLGVDKVINSTHLILSNVEEAVPSRALIHLLDLHPHEMDIVALSIPGDAAVVGKPMSAVEMPPNSFVTLVINAEGPTLPHQDLALQAGDDVIAVTIPDEEQALYEALTGVV